MSEPSAWCWRAKCSTGCDYEYNGELASTTSSSLTNSYAYDPQGQLVQVTLAGGPTTISYELDGVGRRVKRTNSFNSTIERYLWEGSHVVAVMNDAGSVLRRFVYVTSPYTPDAILEGSGPVLYLLVKDERGSVRQVMRASDGVIAENYVYDEWGAQTSAEPANRMSLFGFAGGIYDPSTKLVRFGVRDYDPSAGRWTSKDPSRVAGGLNFFAYAANDPINRVDHSGRDPWSGDAMMDSMLIADGTLSEEEVNNLNEVRGVGVVIGVAGWLALPEISAIARFLGFGDATTGAAAASAGTATAGGICGVARLTGQDQRIMQTAQQLAATGRGFDFDLGALEQAVAQHVSGGQVFLIGNAGGAPVYGSLVTRVGIANINGVTTVVRMGADGKAFEILGGFHE